MEQSQVDGMISNDLRHLYNQKHQQRWDFDDSNRLLARIMIKPKGRGYHRLGKKIYLRK